MVLFHREEQNAVVRPAVVAKARAKRGLARMARAKPLALSSRKMASSDIGSIDISLLMVFDAILTHGSQTEAARRLGMSQPALSHALGRLRAIVDDPLFERTGHGLRPTARAQAMAEPLRTALGALQSALAASEPLEPARLQRTFILDVRTGFSRLLMPRLVPRVLEAAPLANLYVTSAAMPFLPGDLMRGQPEIAIDLAALVQHGVRSALLLEDELVVVSRKGHPAIGRRLTEDAYSRLGHVVLSRSGPKDRGPVADALGQLSSRRIALAMPAASSIAQVLVATDLLVTTPRRHADEYLRTHNLAVHELPFAAPRLRYHLMWHERFDNDAGHKWLRELIMAVCREM
jgi:DNA-binding transcriptional LysR family regulator